MSSKVLLFSTRKIQREGVFQSFQRCPQISKPICDYFLSVNKEKLNDCKENYLKEQKSLQPPAGDAIDSSTDVVVDVDKLYSEWTDGVRTVLGCFDKKAQRAILELISDNSGAAAVNKFISECNKISDENRGDNMALWLQRSIELSSILMQRISEEKHDTGFSEEDFITYSSMPCEVNIDATGKTLLDRVSLYECIGPESPYHVYAVWPLSTPCEDNTWIDSLSKAILEQNKDCEDIILWLHDNDLESTIKSSFHVLYYKKDLVINSKPTRISLGVFQHPDPEFNGVLFSELNLEAPAKGIYESVDSLFSIIDKMQKCNSDGAIAKEYESRTPPMVAHENTN